MNHPQASILELRGDALVSAFALTVAASGAVGFAWFVLGIACLSCGTRPVWHLMKGERSSQWFTRLLALNECPTCGFDAREEGES